MIESKPRLRLSSGLSSPEAQKNVNFGRIQSKSMDSSRAAIWALSSWLRPEIGLNESRPSTW